MDLVMAGASPFNLKRIATDLEATTFELHEAGYAMEAALHRSAWAHVLHTIAARNDDLAVATRADSLSQVAYSMVDGNVAPHQKSVLAMERAHSLFLLEDLKAASPGGDRALTYLDEAARLTAGSQHVPLHRQIKRLRTLITGDTVRRPSAD